MDLHNLAITTQKTSELEKMIDPAHLAFIEKQIRGDSIQENTRNQFVPALDLKNLKSY
jgi:hypothetical protein